MATRKDLLDRKEKIEQAQQGRDLLEKKQTALIQELQEVAAAFGDLTDEMQKVAQRARLALARANGLEGEHAVRAASMRAAGGVRVRIESTTTMGVLLPTFELASGDYVPDHQTALLDEAAAAFHQWVALIMRLAQIRLRVKRLVAELETTSRRLNALDHKTIPRLQTERDAIELSLNERERAAQARLKLFKTLRG